MLFLRRLFRMQNIQTASFVCLDGMNPGAFVFLTMCCDGSIVIFVDEQGDLDSRRQGQGRNEWDALFLAGNSVTMANMGEVLGLQERLLDLDGEVAVAIITHDAGRQRVILVAKRFGNDVLDRSRTIRCLFAENTSHGMSV